MNDLYSKPGHLIRRAHQISSALFAEECAAHDLTPVQYASLVAIHSNPEVDATRLSGLIAFDRSTLGDVLERIEAKGWVRRKSSPNDRRVKLLSLTPAGLELVQQVDAAVNRVQERLLEPLTPEERTVLVRLLARLVRVHNDLAPAPLRAAG